MGAVADGWGIRRRAENSGVEIGEDETAMRREPGDAVVRGVLGEVDERGSWCLDIEAAETGGGGGDGDGQVEPEPGLTGSCRVPDYAASSCYTVGSRRTCRSNTRHNHRLSR